MPEKALSGLSNLLSLALRKNVEKGSCWDEKWALGKERRQEAQGLDASQAGSYYSEHPHQRGVSSGVKGGVVVRRGAVVLPRLVTLRVKRCSLWVQRADWLEGRVIEYRLSFSVIFTTSFGFKCV